MRDSENLRIKYQEVRAKQTEAEVSENLETERKGERFTLIEPPLPPEQPISPKRGLILTLGLILSFVLGVGSAWMRESAAGAVRGPDDLRRLLNVPPLATVPQIVTSEETAAKRRGRRRAAGGISVALIACVTAFHFFVMPLDVLWDIVARRFGS